MTAEEFLQMLPQVLYFGHVKLARGPLEDDEHSWYVHYQAYDDEERRWRTASFYQPKSNPPWDVTKLAEQVVQAQRFDTRSTIKVM